MLRKKKLKKLNDKIRNYENYQSLESLDFFMEISFVLKFEAKSTKKAPKFFNLSKFSNC